MTVIVICRDSEHRWVLKEESLEDAFLMWIAHLSSYHKKDLGAMMTIYARRTLMI